MSKEINSVIFSAPEPDMDMWVIMLHKQAHFEDLIELYYLRCLVDILWDELSEAREIIETFQNSI